MEYPWFSVPSAPPHPGKQRPSLGSLRSPWWGAEGSSGAGVSRVAEPLGICPRGSPWARRAGAGRALRETPVPPAKPPRVLLLPFPFLAHPLSRGCHSEGAVNGVGGAGRTQAHVTAPFPSPVRTNSDSALHTSVMNPNPPDTYLSSSQGAPPPGRRSGEHPLPPRRCPPASGVLAGAPLQCPQCPHVLPLTVTFSLAGFLDGDADSKGEHHPACPTPLQPPEIQGSRQDVGGPGSPWWCW